MDNSLPVEDRFAAALRGFGPVSIISMLIIFLTGNVFIGQVVLPVGGFLVLLWVLWSHTPWRDIGYIMPQNWFSTLAIGLMTGIIFKLIMKALVMPLFITDPINHAYHHLVGNRAMLPAAIWTMIVVGFAEETVFRGYMFERFGKLFGPGVWAKTSIVLLTSLLFGWSHYKDQGFAGVVQATMVGLVFGSVFAITGRIWVLIISHAAFDLMALFIIYLNLESAVAHFIFK